jgi:hypothetical protein
LKSATATETGSEPEATVAGGRKSSRRLGKLNHADAVKAHPDALILWAFRL